MQALGFLPTSLPVTRAAREPGLWPEEGARRRLSPFVVVSSAWGAEGGPRLGGAARSPGLVAPGAPGRAG